MENKNILDIKETFNKAIEVLKGEFNKAIELLQEQNQDKPEYITEKCKPKIGERILITNSHFAEERYENGDILTVVNTHPIFIHATTESGIKCLVHDDEYEVIVEPEQVSPIKELTANQQRAELIEKAKWVWKNRRLVVVEGIYDCFPRFKVNHKKRTVTCELRGISTKFVRKRATARCHPREVFNEDIGRAISFYMAKGTDIPEEFLNAVQPDEAVEGMRIQLCNTDGQVLFNEFRDVVGVNERGHPTFSNGMFASHYKIIDDTSAEYKS